MTSTVYVARRLTDAAMDRLAGTGWDLRLGGEDPPTRAELLAGFAGADAAIVTLTERVDSEVLAGAGPGLRVVATMAVGFDNIDVAAAAGRGVVVANTPGVLDGAAADLAFALLLDVARRVTEADRFVRSGLPWVWGPRVFTGLDLSAGATLGVVGYGRIGAAVARRAKAFDMHVVANAPSREPGTSADGVDFVTLAELLATSDAVSLHCPLLPSTRNLIDRAALATMKPGAYLVNVARGGIVDEEALADALDSGALAGAAFDVYDGEPRVNPRLVASPRTVLTPHIGSAGLATRDVMGNLVIDNVEAVLRGGQALTPVVAKG